MTRKIEFQFDAGQLEELIQNTSQDEVNKAIAYLTTWNMSGFENCQLMINGKDEFTAVYRKDISDPQPGYVIGAVWHNDHFGFHS
tara:strand:+ start:114 stop:368 length:255 start_codon:yes stop_codon:yes gene_type:complete